jgi:hypothetical protein
MGIEGEEVQAKGMCNIFNKIITEKLPSSKISANTAAVSLQNTKQT